MIASHEREALPVGRERRRPAIAHENARLLVPLQILDEEREPRTGHALTATRVPGIRPPGPTDVTLERSGESAVVSMPTDASMSAPKSFCTCPDRGSTLARSPFVGMRSPWLVQDGRPAGGALRSCAPPRRTPT